MIKEKDQENTEEYTEENTEKPIIGNWPGQSIKHLECMIGYLKKENINFTPCIHVKLSKEQMKKFAQFQIDSGFDEDSGYEF